MAEPFLAEIKIVGFTFAPRNWAKCDGQLLPISQNQALFSLLGTNYGGDGETTFGLPDLRGRTPVHEGSGYPLGRKSGQEGVALTTSEVPAHSHATGASSSAANGAEASGSLLAQTAQNAYVGAPSNASLASDSVANAGSGLPHDNMQPYLTLNFIIAVAGLFPSRN